MGIGNPNIAEAGKPYHWKPGQRPPGAGRKPSKLKKYIKDVDFSSHDVELILKNLFANNTIEELKAKLSEGKLPALVWGFVVAYMADARKGASGGGFISQMMERAFGKVKQEIEYSGGISIDTMTADERQSAIAELLAKREKENASGGGSTESNTDKMHGDGIDSTESVSGVSGEPKKTKQDESGEVETTDN
jgi:hypothetical protein